MFTTQVPATTGYALVLAAFGTYTMPVLAQDTQDTQDTLETIVVTAQKREQSVQDVGIAMSVVPEDRIEKLDVTDVLRLATVVPSLTTVDGSAGAPSYRIRGVGIAEFSGVFDGPVGVHVDEVFLFKPALATLGFFDVKRIEVLNGPQGTVFGRNTTAGAVNYYSNTPTDEFEAKVTATYGRFDRLELDGAVSGPLSETVSGRVAAEVKRWGADGPYFNEFNDRKLGKLDTDNFRGILEWRNDGTMIRGTVEYGSKEGELPPYDNLFQTVPGVTEPPNDNIRDPIGRFTVNQNFLQRTDIESLGGNLRIEQETGLGTITSLSAYRDFERLNTEDTDNTPNETVDINWNSRLKVFSQELRLGGERGIWTYLVGAYYEKNSAEILDVFRSGDLFGILAARDYEVDQTTWAVFTNNELALTDKWSAILGARFTSDKQDIKGLNYVGAAGTQTVEFDRIRPEDRIAQSAVDSSQDIEDTATNFRLGLNYKATEDVLLFGSVSTGFRNGGFDLDFFGGPEVLILFEPEQTTAYELGIKSTMFDNSLTLNATAFFMKIKDYQDTVTSPVAVTVTPRRRNTGTLETSGVELDLQWVPHDNWILTLGVATNNAEVVDSNLTINGISFEGTKPPNAPELKFGTTVNYTQPLANGWALDVLLSGQWQDERYLEPENGPDHLVSSFATADLVVSLLGPEKKWRVSAWGKNITDEDYQLYINDIPAISTFLSVRADPVTYGLTLSYQF